AVIAGAVERPAADAAEAAKQRNNKNDQDDRADRHLTSSAPAQGILSPGPPRKPAGTRKVPFLQRHKLRAHFHSCADCLNDLKRKGFCECLHRWSSRFRTGLAVKKLRGD